MLTEIFPLGLRVLGDASCFDESKHTFLHDSFQKFNKIAKKNNKGFWEVDKQKFGPKETLISKCCLKSVFLISPVLVTNDTGFGDEITGNSHHHQPRDFYSTGIGSDDLPPSSSPPPVPNNIPLINHISPSPPPIHSHAIGESLSL